jgi:hypothetical protein
VVAGLAITLSVTGKLNASPGSVTQYALPLMSLVGVAMAAMGCPSAAVW